MDNHADFMPLYRAGLSDAEIGRRLFWSTGTVSFWRAKNGLPANKHKLRAPRKTNPNRINSNSEKMRNLHKSGLLNAEIAEQLNISVSYVRAWLSRQGLKANRISDKQFSRYQELYEKFKNDSEIAEICGVTPSAVAHWRRKRNLPIV